MKKIVFCLLTLTNLPSSALAGTTVNGFDLSANVALTSDYVWRGISQTDENPALQGGFDVNHESGLYLGVWGSNVDFNDGDEATMELDLYGGFAKKFPIGLGVDVGLIHYDYPGAKKALEYDFEEYYLGVNYVLQGVNLSAKYSYSDDFTGSTTSQSASYIDLHADYTLPVGVTLAGHYGHSFGDYFDDPARDNYDDYALSVGGELAGFGLEVAYFGTDNAGDKMFTKLSDDRLVAKVSRKF
ncbi:MAG: TorF family putative porin [Magnetococcus sp. DMHC-6]